MQFFKEQLAHLNNPWVPSGSMRPRIWGWARAEPALAPGGGRWPRRRKREQLSYLKNPWVPNGSMRPRIWGFEPELDQLRHLQMGSGHPEGKENKWLTWIVHECPTVPWGPVSGVWAGAGPAPAPGGERWPPRRRIRSRWWPPAPCACSPSSWPCVCPQSLDTIKLKQ